MPILKKLKLTFGRPRDGLLQHVLVLAGGTIFSQGLLVIAAPLLTRLYTPDEFGFLAVLMAFLSIMLVVVSLRYEMAIPLAKDNDEAANLLGIALSLVGLVTGILGVILWYLAHFFEFPVAILNGQNIWWLMLGMLGAGSYQALKYFCTRNQLFKLLSKTQIGQAITQIVLQIALGMGQNHSMGLIIGYIAAQWIGILTLFKQAKPLLVPPHLSNWIAVANNYKQFPLYTLWASLVNVLGWQIPPLFLATYFSVEVAGWYALTMRVLGMPSALIGQAVAQVFYPLAAQLESPHEAKVLLERVASLLWVLGFPVFAIVFLQGALFFKLIFGTPWEMAGHYAEWLAPWFLFAFVSSPLSTFALVKSRQRQALWLSLYETSLRLSAIGLGVYLDSPDVAIKLFAAAGVIICLVYTSWLLQLAGSSLWILVARLRVVTLIGGLVVTILLLLDQTLSPLWSLGLTTLSLAIFGGWAWQQVEG
jgi:O-antigen/teichoic acid export membrane protein